MHMLHQGINKAVTVIEAQHAKVDVTQLIGVKAFSLDRVLDVEPSFLDVRFHCLVPVLARGLAFRRRRVEPSGRVWVRGLCSGHETPESVNLNTDLVAGIPDAMRMAACLQLANLPKR